MSSSAAGGALAARALLRRQFGLAHDLFDAAMDGLAAEAIHQRLHGGAAQAGACYAQAILCEDLSVNAVLAARTPLALSTWAGRTGLSELPPFAGPTDWSAWSRRVQLDLAALRRYAQAVYAATDACLTALPDEALDAARGARPACLLSALLLTLSMRRGEIACLLASEHLPTADETPAY
jgi:hypothetical protein